MKVLMVLGLPSDFEVNCDEFDFRIAVDGGLSFFDGRNVVPELFIGDVDSYWGGIKCEKVILPREKDVTDFKFAVEWLNGKMKNYDLTVIHGTGGRLDHFWAVVYDMPVGAKLIDRQNKIRKLGPGEHRFEKGDYKYISFFALVKVENLRLDGFKYNLGETMLGVGETYTISNEIEDVGVMGFTKGNLIVFEAND